MGASILRFTVWSRSHHQQYKRNWNAFATTLAFVWLDGSVVVPDRSAGQTGPDLHESSGAMRTSDRRGKSVQRTQMAGDATIIATKTSIRKCSFRGAPTNPSYRFSRRAQPGRIERRGRGCEAGHCPGSDHEGAFADLKETRNRNRWNGISQDHTYRGGSANTPENTPDEANNVDLEDNR